MANTKKRINQGIDTLFDFSLKIKVVTNANGIIQRARVSFTIVATSRAFCPYAAPAPTTELVSCMAIAAQSPNCS